MRRPGAPDPTTGCTCMITHTPAVGSHDTVTGEWLPDKVTTHVRLDFDPDCPMHVDPIACGVCGATTCGATLLQRLKPGWAIRCDTKVAWCPKHTKL